MDVVIQKSNLGVKVEVTLRMNDESSELSITASEIIPNGKIMDVITSDLEARSVAAKLVGRLLTTWKLNLIEGLTTAVAEGLASYLSMSAPRAVPTPPVHED